ncbi:PrsW family intramembrane metalloprotease [Candidatus Gracilibacteria bacterium]|nr:PrsW family intramembrane metalloprotease [Candidatus Gracilibacteria bacterium]
MQHGFLFLLLGFISFLPIVVWAYVFSYIDDDPRNRKRFFMGIFGGVCAGLPILFFPLLLDRFNISGLNVFSYLSGFSHIGETVYASTGLAIFIGFLGLVSCIGGFLLLKNFFQLQSLFFKNMSILVLLSFLLGLVIFGFHTLFGRFDMSVESGIFLGEVFLNSFQLIILYYFVVAFIEEAGKHFNFLQSSMDQIRSPKSALLYAIFVALGFAFIENILYLFSVYKNMGWGMELLEVYFFRSVFSVFVHVICSSVVAYFFSRAFLAYPGQDFSLKYIKIFFSGILLALILHLLFDVALTLEWGFVLFFYFIGGYLAVARLFYSEEG